MSRMGKSIKTEGRPSGCLQSGVWVWKSSMAVDLIGKGFLSRAMKKF